MRGAIYEPVPEDFPDYWAARCPHLTRAWKCLLQEDVDVDDDGRFFSRGCPECRHDEEEFETCEFYVAEHGATEEEGEA